MAMDSMIDIIVNYALNVLKMTCWQIFVLLGPGLILAFLMNLIAGFVEKRAYRLLGRKLYLSLFGWLGTTVHECGHALFCIVFGHKIEEISFFNPDDSSGNLGYVSHSHNPDSLYQTIGDFFIGIGPIILGTIVIYYSARYLLGPNIFSAMKPLSIDSGMLLSKENLVFLVQALWDGIQSVLKIVFTIENFKDWRFYLFLYITFSVGSSVTLSKADIEGAKEGFITLVILLLIFNLVTLWIGNFAIKAFYNLSKMYGIFYSVMFFAIIMNILVAFVVLILPTSAVATKKAVRVLRRKKRWH